MTSHTRCAQPLRLRFAAYSIAGLMMLLCAGLLFAYTHAWSAEQQGYKLGDRLPQKGGSAGAYKETTWEALVPAGWDPMRELAGLDFNTLGDSDPRAIALGRGPDGIEAVADHEQPDVAPFVALADALQAAQVGVLLGPLL